MASSAQLPCVLAALLFVAIPISLRAQTLAQPYASIARDGESYAGAGRASANDLGDPVIRIGLLAPLHGARKAEGDAMVAAAEMALHDAAPDGRAGARKVSLTVEDSSAPSWDRVSDALIRLVLQQDVLALISSSSGADTHLAEQVGNRIGVAVVTLAQDATTTQIDIPWIFRIGPSDAAQAQLLTREIYRSPLHRRSLLITQNGYDGDRAVTEMRRAAEVARAPAPTLIVLDQNASIQTLAERIRAESPDAVVIWTEATVATQLLDALRATGFAGPCYLTGMASRSSSQKPDDDQQTGALWTVAEDPSNSAQHAAFTKHFEQAAGMPPNPIATQDLRRRNAPRPCVASGWSKPCAGSGSTVNHS